MSHWEYNTVCCGVYTKAVAASARLCVIDSIHSLEAAGISPSDYVAAMAEKGWQFVCQAPAVTASSVIVPYQIFFSFRRPIQS